MAIENRNLSAGTVLTATYKKQPFTAEVVDVDGKLAYRLADGQTFKSPSSAGKAAMGGKSCNGWAFWTLATAESEEAPTPDAEPQPAKRGRKATNAPPAEEAAEEPAAA